MERAVRNTLLPFEDTARADGLSSSQPMASAGLSSLSRSEADWCCVVTARTSREAVPLRAAPVPMLMG